MWRTNKKDLNQEGKRRGKCVCEKKTLNENTLSVLKFFEYPHFKHLPPKKSFNNHKSRGFEGLSKYSPHTANIDHTEAAAT